MSKRSDAKHKSDSYEAIFLALAHPSRRQILMTIHFEGGEMNAGEIARMFGHSWPTITRHLGVLVTARLLLIEKQGRNRTYRIDRGRLELVRDWLNWFAN